MSGMPYCPMMSLSLSLMIRSKAFEKPTKLMYTGACHSWHCSRIFRRAKICTEAPLPDRNPSCLLLPNHLVYTTLDSVNEGCIRFCLVRRAGIYRVVITLVEVSLFRHFHYERLLLVPWSTFVFPDSVKK